MQTNAPKSCFDLFKICRNVIHCSNMIESDDSEDGNEDEEDERLS